MHCDMLRRVEIGAAAGTVLAAPSPLADGVGGRREQQQQTREQQQQRWAGAHAWRAMTLTPGEVEIYSSFMNNAPPEARRRLFAAGDRLSAHGGGGAADGRQRLQKYVTLQNQRHFLAANQPSASSPPPRAIASSSPFLAAQASRALGRRSLSWSGLSADSQFRATRAIRKMLFSARRRAAGCGGCVVPADSLDLSAVASGHSPAPVVAVLKTHRGGVGDGRPTSPTRFVVPSRRLGDVRALTGNQAPVATGGFRRRFAGGNGGGLESASSPTTTTAGASTLPAASAQLRSSGVRDRTAAAVAAVAAATAAESRRAAAAANGRVDPRFDARRLQAPVAASAAETIFHANVAATGVAAGGGHSPRKAAVAAAEAASKDEPSPPSNTPDDLSGDLDSMSLHSVGGSGGGTGEFAIEAACLTGSSGMRRIEVYMPALAT